MKLRDYQEESVKRIFQEWDVGHKKTLLVLPTGTGKTIVFSKVAEEAVRQGKRVLILAHRGELLNQAADKIEKKRQKKRLSVHGHGLQSEVCNLWRRLSV